MPEPLREVATDLPERTGVGPIDPALAETTIAALFERQAASHGSRLAISSGTLRLSYEELEARANRLAHAILARPGDPDGCIALLVDQGVAFTTALLAALKAGRAFVPLDPSYPEARLADVLADSGATRIVTQDRHAERAREVAGPAVEILSMDRDGAGRGDARPERRDDPTQVACILYTSGSTGKPKGVVHDHRTLVHNMLRHRVAWGITPDDRQTQLYPCGVYGGIRDLLNALLNGAGLYHFPLREEGYLGLARWIDQQGITIYCSVATVFRHFAHELGGSERFPQLRWVKLGGEAPHRKDVELFQARFSRNTRMMCGLGSTETGMSRFLLVDHDTRLEGTTVPLGYPVDGVDIELLGEDGAPVAPGETGEIVVGSRYVMRGYHGREDLDRALQADSQDPELRRFRTGDLGQIAEDGLLVHRGRKDQQVKVRGNRVELREVEAVLAECPGVREAAVVAREKEGEGISLLAYVVPDGASAPSVSALRRSLRERLPGFMVPQAFVAIERLPQLPNGKVDRAALPDPGTLAPLSASAAAPPVTATERALVPIWQGILQRDDVGIDDSFFDLGGDSLSIVEMLLEIETRLGHALALGELTSEPTIRKLAAAIDGAPLAGGAPGVVRFASGGPLPPLFCLPGRGGTVFCYRGLARRIGSDRAVFGLPLPGLSGGAAAPIDRVEDMADEMIRRVETVAPEGPVALMGYSFGGIVAYEMARRLSERGRRVEYLALVDATAPGAIRLKPLSRRASLKVRSFLHAPWSQKVETLRSPLRVLSRLFRTAPSTLEAPGDADVPTRSGAATQAILRVREAASRARERYRPGRYAGRVCLMRCDAPPELERFVVLDPLYGWGQLAQQGVDVYDVPGPHARVFHPSNLAALATKVAASLAAMGGQIAP